MLMYNVGYCCLISAESGTFLGTKGKQFQVLPLALLLSRASDSSSAFYFARVSTRPTFSLRHNDTSSQPESTVCAQRKRLTHSIPCYRTTNHPLIPNTPNDYALTPSCLHQGSHAELIALAMDMFLCVDRSGSTTPSRSLCWSA